MQAFSLKHCVFISIGMEKKNKLDTQAKVYTLIFLSTVDSNELHGERWCREIGVQVKLWRRVLTV